MCIPKEPGPNTVINVGMRGNGNAEDTRLLEGYRGLLPYMYLYTCINYLDVDTLCRRALLRELELNGISHPTHIVSSSTQMFTTPTRRLAPIQPLSDVGKLQVVS